MAAEIYERDGIRYEIHLQKRSGQFSARWTCPICQATGGPTRWFHFEHEALNRNRVSAFIEHHTVFHLPARRSAEDSTRKTA
jgi:hypothetical protein